jgi:hypothetical protein
MDTNWLKQKYSKPIFDQLLWSRPEQKSQAGTLLIIGGNAHAINAPNEAYSLAKRAGIGEAKVLLPRQTKKFFMNNLPVDVELLEDTPSGSFSTKGLADIPSYLNWADATLFAGDIGRNSETAIFIETIANNYSGIQIYTRDAIEYFSTNPMDIFNRENTLLVVSLSQLQKLLVNLKESEPITFDMGIVKLNSVLSSITFKYRASIVVQYGTFILCASDGLGVVTEIPHVPSTWRLKVATTSAVWWAQNPAKPLEAIATAITQVNWS